MGGKNLLILLLKSQWHTPVYCTFQMHRCCCVTIWTKGQLIRASVASHNSGSFVCSPLTNSHKQRLGKDVELCEANQRGGEVASDQKWQVGPLPKQGLARLWSCNFQRGGRPRQVGWAEEQRRRRRVSGEHVGPLPTAVWWEGWRREPCLSSTTRRRQWTLLFVQVRH